MSAAPTGSLAGVKVLELGTMITASLAGMMLADLGADVVKVEKPDGGDPFRSFRGGLYSPHFTAYNRGKRSMTLDLRQPGGRAVLERLIRDSDVLLENYRPGVMERLGFPTAHLAALNPRLIHASITGFGADGPYAERPAFDTVGLALSGIASLFVDSERPEVRGPTISDNVTGLYTGYGILGALFERERTGRARRVEANMLESSIAFIPDPFANQAQLAMEQDPYTRVAASQSYTLACADGRMIAVHLSSQDKFWLGLVKAIDRGELAADPRFLTRTDRLTHYAALRAELGATFVRRSRAEWMPLLEANDVPYAPIHRVSEVEQDPQVRHLGIFHELSGPDGAPQRAIRRPVLLDGAREPGTRAAPRLGEHTREILLERGFSTAEVDELVRGRLV